MSAERQGTKGSRLNLRIAQEDRTLFDAVAKAQRESLTQFLVESGRERAERLLADRTTFAVSAEDHKAIMAAIERPADVRPELVELFRRARPE
jgi:uncharacterized protein (DUF1778 family)